MASTRTAGITINATGERIINKEHYGVRLFLRLGPVSQEYAEARLRTEVAHLDIERERKDRSRPLFRDCAARYLAQSRNMRSIDVIKWHVQLLITQVGDLEPHKVHDGTLEPFVTSRLASGTGPTTINRTLEVARTILIRAARSYRDDDGKPWLDGMPPMITMVPETPRSPCPITWDEQDRLLRRLPDHLAVMTLFAVNTGLRDSNLCGLQWMWELPIPEIGRSVFVIPPEAFKSKRPHVVILNDAAWSIVQTQRGQHPIWVFPYKSNAVRTMNNTAWQNARRAIGLPSVRVHDLRHTYGARLRAAGVSHEDRAALLGHAHHTMPTFYASPDICRLMELANRVLERIKTVTIVRVAYG